MRICYIDDNEKYLRDFKDNFKDVLSGHVCSIMKTPDEYLKSDEVYDVLLLDIEFGEDGNRLDYIDDIVRKSPLTQIIMVTAYTEKYIQDVFLKKDNVAGFLMKPVTRNALVRVLEKSEEFLERSRTTIMLRTSKNSFKAIRTDDVIYVESEGHNLKYVTAEETYICTGKLDNEFAKPPAGFIRCHKSFCVNMRKISGYNGDDIIIDGYPLIPVSRAKRHEFLAEYTRFLSEK